MVVLAAGASRRMGTPKQLVTFRGKPLLQHVLDTAAPFGPVVVVLGHAAEEVRAAVTPPPGARVVVNPRFAEGQASSLAAGLHAVPAGAAGALVLLGDQPLVRGDAIAAVLAAHAAGGAPILRAAYGGRPGHPVLLTREVFAAAAALTGDTGARALVAGGWPVVAVEVGGEPPRDVDTPADLDVER